MRAPRHSNFILIGMAICDAMRHTGTNEITSSLSSQMNSPKVEMVPDFVKQAKKLGTQNEVAIIFNKQNDPFDPLITLKTKRSSRKRFTGTTSNTAPLKHFKNPQRPRRG
jgi:hypothetical protein